MFRPMMLAAVAGLALAGASGCGQTSAAPTPVGPLALSPEEAAAIAQGDTRVEDEEGGAFIQKARSTPPKKTTRP